MVTRRTFLRAGATMCAFPLIASCSKHEQDASYQQAVKNTWRHSAPLANDEYAVRRELVRYATLAPSSHNTQCWKFQIEKQTISILPDFLRRCAAVDPDNHHLFVSLGCATENLVQAARAFGIQGEANFDASQNGGIKVSLSPSHAVTTDLYQAIPERQCTRSEYDGLALSSAEISRLEKAGTGNGVYVLIFSEKEALEKILEYVTQANTAQMNDHAFVEELKRWIRFNNDEAISTGDGLSTLTTGNPSTPSWLGRLLFEEFFTAKSENDKYAKHVRSSAGIAVFVSEVNDPVHWIEVGRCYQRFALQSTAMGIRNAFLNQPVEVSNLRQQFATFLNVKHHRPDLVVRFGRGPKMPQSLRRNVQAVLV